MDHHWLIAGAMLGCWAPVPLLAPELECYLALDLVCGNQKMYKTQINEEICNLQPSKLKKIKVLKQDSNIGTLFKMASKLRNKAHPP